MDVEEHWGFYIHRKTITDADGAETECFDVGKIIEVDGLKRYPPTPDPSFSTRDEAIVWIEARG